MWWKVNLFNDRVRHVLLFCCHVVIDALIVEILLNRGCKNKSVFAHLTPCPACSQQEGANSSFKVYVWFGPKTGIESPIVFVVHTRISLDREGDWAEYADGGQRTTPIWGLPAYKGGDSSEQIPLETSCPSQGGNCPIVFRPLPNLSSRFILVHCTFSILHDKM